MGGGGLGKGTVKDLDKRPVEGLGKLGEGPKENLG